jgi:hypothetical protein
VILIDASVSPAVVVSFDVDADDMDSMVNAYEAATHKAYAERFAAPNVLVLYLEAPTYEASFPSRPMEVNALPPINNADDIMRALEAEAYRVIAARSSSRDEE